MLIGALDRTHAALVPLAGRPHLPIAARHQTHGPNRAEHALLAQPP
jgi:hypothetical protein